ncbi:MAG: triose-phosphate isomerase [Gemmatimonadetes bacterium]|nr:triose-phosphate isomerase [Gemmatimonadota bacterium]
MNKGNVLALLAEDELDGVLVGGASLDVEGWAEMVGF